MWWCICLLFGATCSIRRLVKDLWPNVLLGWNWSQASLWLSYIYGLIIYMLVLGERLQFERRIKDQHCRMWNNSWYWWVAALRAFGRGKRQSCGEYICARRSQDSNPNKRRPSIYSWSSNWTICCLAIASCWTDGSWGIFIFTIVFLYIDNLDIYELCIFMCLDWWIYIHLKN